MTTTASVAPCIIRDAEREEAAFCDLVVAQSGVPVPAGCDDAAVRVAVRQGQVVGFARVTVAADAPWLDDVFVHHDARRRGVGRALVGSLGPDRDVPFWRAVFAVG